MLIASTALTINCIRVSRYRTALTQADPMQLVDELSMIYTTCLMMYASFAYSRSRYFSTMLGFCLLGVAGFITVRFPYSTDARDIVLD